MKTEKIALGMIFFLFALGAAQATTWYVDVNNTTPPWLGTKADPFYYIGDGIAATSPGDTVLVMPGTYFETVMFPGHDIVLRSQKGPGATIIDGEEGGPVVAFVGGETRDSILDGFTITNGTGWFTGGSLLGGGIYCMGVSPTINGNIVRDNNAGFVGVIAGFGGGIFCDGGAPLITNNIIMHNQSGDDGAGISLGMNVDCDAEVINNLFLENETGNTMGYSGGGADCWSGSPVFVNNTFVGNSADKTNGWGGGMRCVHADVSIINCIFWGNFAGRDPEISNYYGSVDVSYSDILLPYGVWPGTGNINSPPLFAMGFGGDNYHVTYSGILQPCGVGPGGGNSNSPPLFTTGSGGGYYLSQSPPQGVNSPCVDAGDPTSPMIHGTTCTLEIRDTGVVDMGFHYSLPLPDIKINGVDGPLTVTTTDQVTVTVSLDPARMDGDPADWWVSLERENGDKWWARFRKGQMPKWTKSTALIRFAGATLRRVTDYAVLGPRALPAGTYTWYFAIDDMNGVLEQTYIDSAVLTVQ